MLEETALVEVVMVVEVTLVERVGDGWLLAVPPHATFKPPKTPKPIAWKATVLKEQPPDFAFVY